MGKNVREVYRTPFKSCAADSFRRRSTGEIGHSEVQHASRQTDMRSFCLSLSALTIFCAIPFITGMNRGRTDMATPYLREALRFIGLSNVRFVPIGPTAGPAEAIRTAREAARRRLAELAAAF
jgi:hypothetical protein